MDILMVDDERGFTDMPDVVYARRSAVALNILGNRSVDPVELRGRAPSHLTTKPTESRVTDMTKRNELDNPFETLNRSIKVAKVTRALSGSRVRSIRNEIRDHGTNEIGWQAVAQIAGVPGLSDVSREAVQLQLRLEDLLDS